MKCPQCKIVEMLVIRVKDNIVEYKCKQCEATATEEIEVGVEDE